MGMAARSRWVSRLEDGALKAVSGPDMMVLHSPVEVQGVGLKTVAEFTVSAGDRLRFVLTYGPSHPPPPRAVEPDSALAETEAFWEDWSENAETAENGRTPSDARW